MTTVARAAQRSRTEARDRVRRMVSRMFFIVQCGLGAAVAWWVASDVLHHTRPFFAPVTAIISLGMSFGQRLRRVTEVMIGVAVGVFTGDLFVHFFGSGVWQLGVVVVVAMSIAALLGAGMLLISQAGAQSVIVTTLVAAPGQAFTRWLDAVIGGLVALLFTLVAPAAPLRRPRQQAAVVVRELGAILADTVRALADHDADLASATLARARASEHMLDELRALSAEGIAVVRLSPLRRRHLPGVQAIADLLEPLDRAIRNLRVLVRRAAIATWREEPVPTAYLQLLTALAQTTEDIARELQERRLPVNARTGLHRIAELSAVIDPSAGLSGEVMRAQIRSMVVDLLMLTGLPQDEARDQVPESFGPTTPTTPADR
ncbi:aromatic acid exporter family protein [Nostocoides sp. HKS02]|uniref:FUSC family protein n=1 Tax=Nostocoides sp. HKS02 TaxID=1813880 RepID=UPI001E4EB6C1|nr:FUSC family protein [Tetrasphaera sp. HKS02]